MAVFDALGGFFGKIGGALQDAHRAASLRQAYGPDFVNVLRRQKEEDDLRRRLTEEQIKATAALTESRSAKSQPDPLDALRRQAEELDLQKKLRDLSPEAQEKAAAEAQAKAATESESKEALRARANRSEFLTAARNKTNPAVIPGFEQQSEEFQKEATALFRRSSAEKPEKAPEEKKSDFQRLREKLATELQTEPGLGVPKRRMLSDEEILPKAVELAQRAGIEIPPEIAQKVAQRAAVLENIARAEARRSALGANVRGEPGPQTPPQPEPTPVDPQQASQAVQGHLDQGNPEELEATVQALTTAKVPPTQWKPVVIRGYIEKLLSQGVPEQQWPPGLADAGRALFAQERGGAR